MAKSPCYDDITHTDCLGRHVGCRKTCTKWAEYEVAKHEEYAKRNEEFNGRALPNMKRINAHTRKYKRR
jgi:hypothetical protein